MSLIPSRFLIFFLSCSLTTSLAGCGAQAPEGLVPADGVFRWNSGEPLAGIPGIARFHPFDPDRPQLETSAESAEQVVSARLEPDGSFLVETSRLVNRKAHDFSGVAPGQYKVMLFLLPGEQGILRINPDYQHPVRTPLMVEIHEGQPNHLELIVEHNLNGWQP